MSVVNTSPHHTRVWTGSTAFQTYQEHDRVPRYLKQDFGQSAISLRCYDGNEQRLQSTSYDLLDALRPVVYDNELRRHEQKHLQPMQPAHEFSMHMDGADSGSPWTGDDPTLWDSGMQNAGNYILSEGLSQDTMDLDDFVSCAECNRRFESYQKLEQHGKETAHLPFECTEPLCFKRLARRDTMQRHMALHKEPQYSCRFCKDKGVSRSFTRNDHRKRHESKCQHRPATDTLLHRPSCSSLRSDARRSSTTSMTSTRSLKDAELKKKKIRELMGPILPPRKFQELQRGLATMNDTMMHELCMNVAQTVMGEASGEMKKIRSVEVNS